MQENGDTKMSLIKFAAAKWRGAVKSLLQKSEHSGAEKSFLQTMSNNVDRFTNDPLYKITKAPAFQADNLKRFKYNKNAISPDSLVTKLHNAVKPINPNR